MYDLYDTWLLYQWNGISIGIAIFIPRPQKWGQADAGIRAWLRCLSILLQRKNENMWVNDWWATTSVRKIGICWVQARILCRWVFVVRSWVTGRHTGIKEWITYRTEDILSYSNTKKDRKLELNRWREECSLWHIWRPQLLVQPCRL